MAVSQIQQQVHYHNNSEMDRIYANLCHNRQKDRCQNDNGSQRLHETAYNEQQHDDE